MPCASAPKAPCVEVWLIAADDRGAGQRQALLGADDVHDALAVIVLAEIFDAEFLGVLSQRRDLQRRFRIVDAVAAVGGRHVVIGHGQRQVAARELCGRSRADPRRPARW